MAVADVNVSPNRSWHPIAGKYESFSMARPTPFGNSIMSLKLLKSTDPAGRHLVGMQTLAHKSDRNIDINYVSNADKVRVNV